MKSAANSARAASTAGVDSRVLVTKLSPAQIVEKLGTRSKRGKLAGYELRRSPSAGGPAVIRLLAFGGIYDHELICTATAMNDVAGEGTRMSFELRLLRKMPLIAIALLVISVFPGLPLMDSMLVSYFSWYTIETWWWYLPLVALTVPFMWKQYISGRSEARADAMATIDKLAVELEARPA